MTRSRPEHSRPAVGLAVLALLTLSCSSLRKPAEMTMYEEEHTAPQNEMAVKKYPQLAENAQSHYRLAAHFHEEKEGELVAHHAKVTMLWWRAATTRAHADVLVAKRKKTMEEVAAIHKELIDARKQEKLARSSIERAKQVIALQGKVADSEGNNAARDAINGALTALKDAETVDAGTHAKDKFQEAERKLEAATKALAEGKSKKAETLAAEAEAAAASAKEEAAPRYANTKAEQDRTANQRALFDALGAIGGVTAAIVEGGVLVTIVESFDHSGIDIKPAMQATYAKIADVAKSYSTLSLVIEGHTDSKGKSNQNLQLSDARAKSVMSFLAAKGVAPGRMTALGKGSEEPVGNNKTPEGRSKNRRIEILFATPGM